jgi:hypothetical protein
MAYKKYKYRKAKVPYFFLNLFKNKYHNRQLLVMRDLLPLFPFSAVTGTFFRRFPFHFTFSNYTKFIINVSEIFSNNLKPGKIRDLTEDGYIYQDDAIKLLSFLRMETPSRLSNVFKGFVISESVQRKIIFKRKKVPSRVFSFLSGFMYKTKLKHYKYSSYIPLLFKALRCFPYKKGKWSFNRQDRSVLSQIYSLFVKRLRARGLSYIKYSIYHLMDFYGRSIPNLISRPYFPTRRFFLKKFLKRIKKKNKFKVRVYSYFLRYRYKHTLFHHLFNALYFLLGQSISGNFKKLLSFLLYFLFRSKKQFNEQFLVLLSFFKSLYIRTFRSPLSTLRSRAKIPDSFEHFFRALSLGGFFRGRGFNIFNYFILKKRFLRLKQKDRLLDGIARSYVERNPPFFTYNINYHKIFLRAVNMFNRQLSNFDFGYSPSIKYRYYSYNSRLRFRRYQFLKQTMPIISIVIAPFKKKSAQVIILDEERRSLFTSNPSNVIRSMSKVVGLEKVGKYNFLLHLKKKESLHNSLTRVLVIRNASNFLYRYIQGRPFRFNLIVRFPFDNSDKYFISNIINFFINPAKLYYDNRQRFIDRFGFEPKDFYIRWGDRRRKLQRLYGFDVVTKQDELFQLAKRYTRLAFVHPFLLFFKLKPIKARINHFRARSGLSLKRFVSYRRRLSQTISLLLPILIFHFKMLRKFIIRYITLVLRCRNTYNSFYRYSRGLVEVKRHIFNFRLLLRLSLMSMFFRISKKKKNRYLKSSRYTRFYRRSFFDYRRKFSKMLEMFKYGFFKLQPFIDMHTISYNPSQVHGLSPRLPKRKRR